MATITVTTRNDVVSAGDGLTSLREAIATANAAAGDDTIVFASGIGVGTAPLVLTQGELVIDNVAAADTGRLTIRGALDGAGDPQVTISGNDASRVLRINGDGTGDNQAVTLDGLVIRDGKVSGITYAEGGGIVGYNAAVEIQDCRVVDNLAAGTVGSYGAAYGGGIYVGVGSLSLTRSAVTGNSAEGSGSSGITAGGGIAVNGTTLTIVDSAIADNFAGGSGLARAGGIRALASSGTIAGSTISGNQSIAVDGSDGGGLSFGSFTDFAVTNSTVAGNFTSGTVSKGGGIYSRGTLTLTNVTIAGNEAYGGVEAGGLHVGAGTTTLRNTIVAGNTGDVTDVYGTIVCNGHNMFGQAAVTGSTAGDLLGIADAKLGRLADNGGQTQTMALLFGSLALDGGSNAVVNTLATDQRGTGFVRVSNGTVDIGAFELPVINGNGSANTLTGTAFIERLNGLDGNDVLNGKGGNDTLDGGTGTDIATWVTLAGPGGVVASLATNTGTSTEGTDTLVAIENLTGSNQADTLTGNGAVNTLAGLNGNDILCGGGGNDRLDGGGGTDTADFSTLATGGVVASLTTNTASSADGADTLVAIENLTGSNGADTLTGSGAANRLAGGNGNDTLNGRAGTDTLDGGTGIDTVTYATLTTAVTASLATNTATSADGTDSFIAVENLTGGGGADRLTGNGAANVLNGGAGNDTLTGGGGKDTLTGATGNDRFVFTLATDSPLGANRDVITEFTHGATATSGDKIDVSTIDANSGVAGNQAFVWKGAGALTGAAQAHYATIGGVKLIQFSTDADAAAEFEIQIPTAFTPGAIDLIL